jgi:hypothetical protein
MTRITIEVEPVLLEGSVVDKQFYGFKVLGLVSGVGSDLVVYSSCGSYPGNAAVREFINSKAKHGANPEMLKALKDLLVITLSRGERLGLDDCGPVLDNARNAIANYEAKS